jgi:hypothetical protein
MALSKKARSILEIATTHRVVAKEIADAIDAGGASAPVAASVALIPASADIGVTDGVAGDAAIAADVEARMDAVEVKINAVISALKAAGLMA